MADVKEHKCPACGGTLNFDVSSQKVKCPYCDSEFEVSELQEFAEPKEEVVLESAPTEEWGAEELGFISEYHCESCGGDIFCDDNTSATKCPYCGNAVILTGRLSGSLRPNKVIPFKRSEEDAKNTYRNFAKGKFLAPKKFTEESTIEEIKGMYAPYWLFGAEIDGNIRYHACIIRHWVEGDYDVEETNHYNAVRRGDIAFDNVPVDGSSKLDDTMMESIEPFYYQEAMDFQSAYLSGYLADKYDVDQEQAKPRASERMVNETRTALESTLGQYDTYRETGCNINATKSSTEYVLYPIWLLNTKWKDKMYSFTMNGQTGKMAGNLPTDPVKGGLLMALIAIAVAAIGIGIFAATSAITVTYVAICILLGIGLAVLVFFLLRRQLKTVKAVDTAANYYRPESFKLKFKSDVFLYREVHRYKRHTND